MSTVSSQNPNKAIVVDSSGGTNAENLLSPMPDTVLGTRNTINAASISSCNTHTNLGAAASNAGNHIAKATMPATGAGTGGSVFNAAFVDDDLTGVTSLIVATILGAYDQVCNSTGSCVVAAPHSMVKQSTGGHNNIVGGSTCVISGTSTRSSIWGCTTVAIVNGNFTSAIGSQNCGMTGATFTHAVGCNGTTITATRSLIAGTASQTISGACNLVVGDVTHSGSYGVSVGQTLTVTGSYGCTIGSDLTNAKNNAAVFGANGAALQNESLNLCGSQITTKADVAWCKSIDGASSTGSAATLSLVQFPAGVNCVAMVTASLVGKVVGSDKVIGWSTKFAVRINGSTTSIIDGTGSGADLYRSPDFDDSGLTYSAGNSGKIRITAGSQLLRLSTPGFSDAATTVKWVATADITLTREDTVS